ncbi:protein translocase subunit yajC [Thermodesulfitimonas autotrophica]|uniref:Protein translocase subunit yajC n=1 Tax=Thermodesulfitimonas autotrophica TaxID=1894989 RepID=A0A3N5AAT1_9THEO|nr:preprotein translocase subunit YajC [Thermodesulfitimonas autotrophica]RPF42709.1 protein translocase subunit yajC [Thermodesulfitimonas autotrophica]
MNQQLISILYLIGLFVLFYFLLIRPQQVRQKRHQEMIRNLKTGDRVITAGGIYGSVVKIKEDSVILRVADNVRIEVLKQAIAQVAEKGEENARD